jgi:hypothetical protein
MTITPLSGPEADLLIARLTERLKLTDPTAAGLKTALGGGAGGADGPTVLGIQRAQSALKMGRPPIVGFVGDSISDAMADYYSGTASPFFHALMRLSRRDLYIDPTEAENDGTGGYNFGVGGTSSSYLLNPVTAGGKDHNSAIAKINAKTVKPDLLVLSTLQNDAATQAKAQLDIWLGHVRTFIQQALAAGVRLVIIMPRPPYNGQVGSTVVQGHAYLNRKLQEFAKITPDVVFVNYLPLVRAASPAAENNGAASVVGWKGVNGQYTADGVHLWELTHRAIAPLLVPILEEWGQPVQPRADNFADWDEPNWPTANLLGRAGMCYNYAATNGQYNGAGNANVATNWTLSDHNGIIATPTLVTGADGFPRQRITFSGTASADAVIPFRTLFYGTGGAITLARFNFECMLDLVNVVGMRSWQVEVQNLVDLFTSETKDLATPLSESYFLRTLRDFSYSNAGFSSKYVEARFRFAAGVSPTGYVEFGRAGIFRTT